MSGHALNGELPEDVVTRLNFAQQTAVVQTKMVTAPTEPQPQTVEVAETD